MKKGVVFRAYPTKEQKILLDKTFRCCRLIYNRGLDMRQSAYESGKKVGYNETSAMLTALKKEKEFKFLTEVDSVALQHILGDFSMEKEEKTCKLLDALNGYKHLIKGNHDRVSSRVQSRYKSVNDYLEINDNGTRVILCHYPIVFYNKCLTHNTVHLYGHVHITSEHDYIERFRKEIIKEENDNRFGPQHPCLFFNVGCMMPYKNYTPRTLEEILESV